MYATAYHALPLTPLYRMAETEPYQLSYYYYTPEYLPRRIAWRRRDYLKNSVIIYLEQRRGHEGLLLPHVIRGSWRAQNHRLDVCRTKVSTYYFYYYCNKIKVIFFIRMKECLEVYIKGLSAPWTRQVGCSLVKSIHTYYT